MRQLNKVRLDFGDDTVTLLVFKRLKTDAHILVCQVVEAEPAHLGLLQYKDFFLHVLDLDVHKLV